MAYVDSKKAVIATYEILKKYSSYDRPLSNVQISEYLRTDYNLKASRNTIKNTLIKLIEIYGDNVICCNETDRLGPDGQENTYTSSYYFDRDEAADVLSDEDIAILIDVCLYARNLTSKEAKELISNLRNMATAKQRKKLDYTDDIPEKQFNINKKTSDNLQQLRSAISKNHGKNQQWVSFYFNYYNRDKKLAPSEDRYVVLPLRVCEANHKYYLICAMEGSNDKLYHYRIDLMTRLRYEVRDTIDDLWELNKNLIAKDISDYMSTHLYMFYDNPRLMEIIIPREDKTSNMTFLVDAFGVGSIWRVKSESEHEVTVSITCSPNAMKVFIMQYASFGIRVAGPNDVKMQIEEKLRKDCTNILKQI